MTAAAWITALLVAAVLVGGAYMLRSRPVRGIAAMTFAEGVRMRIVLVFVLVLLFLVLILPSSLQGESTVAHRLQTFLTWSLNFLGFFMGLATIFFSCSTLSQEFRNKTMHMIVVKPVTRFEVLAGKWMGVNLLNLLVVGLCGLAVYGFARVIRNQTEEFSRDRIMVNDAIWSARVAIRPTQPDFSEEARAYVADRMKREGAVLDPDAAFRQRVNDLNDLWRRVPPGQSRKYEFHGVPTPDPNTRAFQLRFKARTYPLTPDEMVRIVWVVIDPRNDRPVWDFKTERRATEMHQFLLGAAAVYDGRAAIGVINPADPTQPGPQSRATIAFEGPDSLELLYKVGSFEANFVRSMVLILCILAFLSAVGLFFATFASFPVAAFCTISIALFCMGSPWWLEVIGTELIGTSHEGGKIDPYGKLGPYIRPALSFVLKVALPDFGKYSGIDSLIDGYAIQTAEFFRYAAHTLVYGIVLLVLPGWLIFQRREVAEVIV